MELEEQHHPAWKFWSPAVTYKVPEPESGHCYIKLEQNFFSARFDDNLMHYPMLAESINAPTFISVVNSANFVIKTPYFKHLFVRYFLCLIAFIYFVNFAVACGKGDKDIVGIIFNLIVFCLCPFGMRLGANQYLIRMHKFKKVLQKAMAAQCNTVLLGCGIIVEAGDKCLWLHFHQGSYTPPSVQVNYFQNAAVIYPGVQVNV